MTKISVSGGSEDDAGPRFKKKIKKTLALEGKPQNRSKMFCF